MTALLPHQPAHATQPAALSRTYRRLNNFNVFAQEAGAIARTSTIELDWGGQTPTSSLWISRLGTRVLVRGDYTEHVATAPGEPLLAQPAGTPLQLDIKGIQLVEQSTQTFTPTGHRQTTSVDSRYATTLSESSVHPDNHQDTFGQTTSADADTSAACQLRLDHARLTSHRGATQAGHAACQLRSGANSRDSQPRVNSFACLQRVRHYTPTSSHALTTTHVTCAQPLSRQDSDTLTTLRPDSQLENLTSWISPCFGSTTSTEGRRCPVHPYGLCSDH